MGGKLTSSLGRSFQLIQTDTTSCFNAQERHEREFPLPILGKKKKKSWRHSSAMINQEKHFEFFIYDQVSTLFHDKAGSSDQFIKTNARLPTLFFFSLGS